MTEPKVPELPGVPYSASGVLSEEIPLLWEVLEPMVQKATDRALPVQEITSADLYQRLLDKKAQCWIVFSQDQIVGLVITQIVQRPNTKILQVLLTSGKKGSMIDWFPYFEVLKDFGRFHGCSHLRVAGRKGWEKILKPANVRVEFDLEL